MNYTIGITTFDKRFDQLKSLILSIRKHCGVPIIVVVNGNFCKSVNESYRVESLRFFSEIKNIFPVYFTEMRGWAKMVNTIFIHSNTENVLVLNDDINILNEAFFEDVKYNFSTLKDIRLLGPIDIELAIPSFSHFMAKKSFMYDIGYFDERLLGFGEEDGDLIFRYFQKNNVHPEQRRVRGLEHLQSITGHELKKGVHKYSLFNQTFIHNKKYKKNSGVITTPYGVPCEEIIPNTPQYPHEKFFEENKYELDYKLHFVTPGFRPNYIKRQLEYLCNFEQENFIWHIIMDDKIEFSIFDEDKYSFLKNKIKFYSIKTSLTFGFEQRNYFIKEISKKYCENDWVYFLDDDNLPSKDVFFVWNKYKHTNKINTVLMSQIRFFNGIKKLFGKKGHEQTYKVDIGSFLAKNIVFNNKEFKQDLYTADGLFIEELYNENPDSFAYEEEYNSYYNILLNNEEDTRAILNG